MKDLLNKLKLNKHYKIERFGLSFMILASLMTVFIFLGAYTQFTKDKDFLKTQALYTSTFEMSKTKAAGKVEGVYVSENRKNALVVLKFDDILKMSTDANNYQMFLAAVKPRGGFENLKTRPSGSIVMFGSTGYMGLYFTSSDKPFEPQLLTAVLRSKSELDVSDSNTDEVGNTDDKTKDNKKNEEETDMFKKYDQVAINFNPGGSLAVKTKSLNDSNFNVSDVFKEVVANNQEKLLKAQLEKQTEVLRVDLNRIDEYENRIKNLDLNGASIVLPERNKYIKGDKYDAKTKTIEFASVVPRGFNFDWKSKSVDDGYLSDLVPVGKASNEFLAEKSKEADDETMYNNRHEYYLSDGSKLADYQDKNDLEGSVTGDIEKTIGALEEAYNTYIRDKATFQSNTLKQLLVLELQIINVESNNSINVSDKALTLY